MLPKTQLKKFHEMIKTFETRFSKFYGVRSTNPDSGESADEQKENMKKMEADMHQEILDFAQNFYAKFGITKENQYIDSLNDADNLDNALFDDDWWSEKFPLAHDDDDDDDRVLPDDKKAELVKIKQGFKALILKNNFIHSKQNQEFLKEIEKYFEDTGITKMLVMTEL